MSLAEARALPLSPALSGRLVTAALVLKLLMLFALALNTRLVMDEFWHLHQAQYVWNGAFTDIWPEKALLYAAFFKLAALAGDDAVAQVLTARMLAAGLATAVVGVTYATARALGQSAFRAVIIALILLSFSTFIERGFRLRSEPLALFFAASALWVVIRHDANRARTILIAGLLSGLAFVATQKSAYFNFALGSALVVEALVARSVVQALQRAALLIAGWLAAIAVYALVFGGSNAAEVFRFTFLGPLEVATTAQDHYGSLRHFVAQTLVRNAPLYLACFAGLALTLARFRSLTQGQRLHLVFTLVMAVLVFRHNQPWPYVFTMVLPFLAPYAPALLDRFPEARQRTLLLVFALVVAASFVRNIGYVAHDNHTQLDTLRAAEALVPEGETYFDGLGMLPNRKTAPYVWLDAMNMVRLEAEGPTGRLPRALASNPPLLVIQSYRTERLSPLLAPALAGYVPAGTNLLLRPDAAAGIIPGDGQVVDLYEDVYSR
ncbi:DUF7056 domain-containing protein [Mesobacterium pallidum]|uniref:DUF7056 domain-containing protein n=1 Tax=Mesobacterium pallidum TaxID=2872037 RepID=UPI001EE2753B|nr:hypothetical protein [Mesobacterium pallidum]